MGRGKLPDTDRSQEPDLPKKEENKNPTPKRRVKNFLERKT